MVRSSLPGAAVGAAGSTRMWTSCAWAVMVAARSSRSDLIAFPAYQGVSKGRSMSRRMECRRVLDAEVRRWSEMSAERLSAELHEVRAYEVEVDSKRYQVEVV